MSKVTEIFGSMVFDDDTMEARLPKDTYKALQRTIKIGKHLDLSLANIVANAMKDWAIEKGATHYTHWFQPMTGITAEKHDSFISPKSGKVIMEFSGKELIQGEPDASSFPSGGLRATFEARGYTAWDATSYAFIKDGVLCIPTVFCSYGGEALDQKTALLRSMEAINRQAMRVLKLFGNTNVQTVKTTVGPEQEYFLIPKDLYDKRKDLIYTGRTLFGAMPPKGQELDDHYFGAIPSRVLEYMKEFEEQAYRLGIPIKTRHNEVAPNQFECAPMFEEANIAVDHNTLLMTVMRKVALKHKLRVLFHEKPFAGVNGSGKHCNWSMMTDTGVNLLAPGKTPKNNIQFLTFFVNAIKAAHDYGTLFMASIATQSNSHRLGAHEAPPAVMSVFAGSTLSDMLDSIEERVSDKKMTPDEKTDIKLDIGKIPDILLDNTDRNRTSPFAFTGNRFEFRATGSSHTCAAPLTVINTAIAEELIQFKKEVDALIDKGVKKDEAILQVIRKYIIASKKIRFEGNGYSQAWLDEAGKRGLESIGSIPEAFTVFNRPQYKELLTKHGVYSESEICARYEINLEILIKKIQIESRVLADMAANHIVPTAIKYQNVLIQNVQGLKDIMPDEYMELASEEIRAITKIAKYVKSIREHNRQMIDARKKYNNTENIIERANGYWDVVRPIMSVIRQDIDKLELIVDDELWPLPKYREMMSIN